VEKHVEQIGSNTGQISRSALATNTTEQQLVSGHTWVVIGARNDR
jgi:hypothetical protein